MYTLIGDGWMWAYVFLILIVLFVSMTFEDEEHGLAKALTIYVLIAGLAISMW
ncbi:hypothetical protein [Limosilactobacillus reuteri]|uniref:hypothetical protein n=1 Tax=Limosilactobacillus reuteri TaxID=1598 RepID=UPI003CC61D75